MAPRLNTRLVLFVVALGLGTLVGADWTTTVAARPLPHAGGAPTGSAASPAGISFQIEAAVSGINDANGLLNASGIKLGDIVTGTVTYTADTPSPYLTNSYGGGTESYFDLSGGNPPYVISVQIESRSTGQIYQFSNAGLTDPHLHVQVANNINGTDTLAFWSQGPFDRFDVQASCGAASVSVVNHTTMLFTDYEGAVLDDAVVPAQIPQISLGGFDLGRIDIGSWIPTGSTDCPGQYFGISADIHYVRPATINVLVDIRPGTAENTIHVGSSGLVPVAILGSAMFDVSTVNPESLQLEGAAVGLAGKSGRYMCSVQDVNGDGYNDMLCQFDAQTLDLEVGDAIAVLTGKTNGGTPIRGQDVVRVVPNK